ncbi:MAG: molybdate ABC transporter substrate-binding protein [Pseudomonadota bacterium]
MRLRALRLCVLRLGVLRLGVLGLCVLGLCVLGLCVLGVATAPLPLNAPARAETAQTGSVRIAVASNFSAAAEALARRFEERTGAKAILILGATGKHYAQIVRGAPFDLFLAADEARPTRLEAEGLTAPGSRFAYAYGRLALWSRRADRLDATIEASLRAPGVRRVALANPALAPYGRAAEEALDALGLRPALAGRLAYGENVGQAFAMAASGAADLALISEAQARSWTGSGAERAEEASLAAGSAAGFLLVPETAHAPIRQDAVLLTRGADNPAARAFVRFLTSETGRAIIEQAGYAAAPPTARPAGDQAESPDQARDATEAQ